MTIVPSLLALSLLATSLASSAGLFRAYLASDGLDTNPCTITAPCRLLPAALAAVNDGGEVWMLDSANYNTATVDINKSVTILAIPGAVGSVVSTAGGPALSGSTGGTRIALRNIVVGRLSGSNNGIFMVGPAIFSIEDSLVSGGPYGIFIGGGTIAQVTRCTVRDNSVGINVAQGVVTVAWSSILGNGSAGIRINGLANSAGHGTITDTVISGGGNGIEVNATFTNSIARAAIVRTTISDNGGTGIQTTAAGGLVLVNIGYNLVTRNAVGLSVGGTAASIETSGTNMVRNNAVDVNGALTGALPL